MSSEPLVSILIPAYNCEKWIAGAIKSALAQTWPRIEVIVVDDGSRDRTVEVAGRFASDRVRVVSQPNRGASAARNAAYSLAQGDYIQWLDADDLLHPDKIRLQMAEADSLASGKTLLSSEWGYFYHRCEKARFVPTALWCDLTPSEWMMRQMEQNLHMQTATWLVSRALSEAAGLWDPRMLVDDDGEYFCRVMTHSDGIKFVPGAMMFYRRSGSGSLCHIGRSDPKKEAQFLSMRLHISYLLSLENTERARAACVRYLQNWLIHFHPDRPDIVAQARRLANDLGGSLEIPDFPRKYRWIQKTFGATLARRVQMAVPNLKTNIIRSVDRALYLLRP